MMTLVMEMTKFTMEIMNGGLVDGKVVKRSDGSDDRSDEDGDDADRVGTKWWEGWVLVKRRDGSDDRSDEDGDDADRVGTKWWEGWVHVKRRDGGDSRDDKVACSRPCHPGRGELKTRLRNSFCKF